LRSPNLRNLGRGSFDTKAPHLLSYDLVTISYKLTVLHNDALELDLTITRLQYNISV
jgi:hypothetical protein